MSRESFDAELAIGSKTLGGSRPLFTIAEIGLNHGGSVDRALALVDAAASAGVSAIKLQVLTAKALVGPSLVAPAHVNVPSLQAFFETFELDEADYRRIVARARAKDLGVLATPLSLAAVDMLDRIGIDAFKIASGDLTWDQLLHRAAATKKPLVISTGMASLSEVAHALAVARIGGASGVALLHCTSAYPVPRGEENLRAIATMRTAFGVPVGLSDHGPDLFAVPIAVALGASVYERHIVLHEHDGSIDAPVSSTPDGFTAIVQLAARTQEALGRGVKACGDAEAANLVASRRSLCAVRALPAGHVVAPGDVIALRPATGLAPVWEPALIGMRLRRDVAAGSAFLETDLESRMTHEVA